MIASLAHFAWVFGYSLEFFPKSVPEFPENINFLYKYWRENAIFCALCTIFSLFLQIWVKNKQKMPLIALKMWRFFFWKIQLSCALNFQKPKVFVKIALQFSPEGIRFLCVKFSLTSTEVQQNNVHDNSGKTEGEKKYWLLGNQWYLAVISWIRTLKSVACLGQKTLSIVEKQRQTKIRIVTIPASY